MPSHCTGILSIRTPSAGRHSPKMSHAPRSGCAIRPIPPGCHTGKRDPLLCSFTDNNADQIVLIWTKEPLYGTSIHLKYLYRFAGASSHETGSRLPFPCQSFKDRCEKRRDGKSRDMRVLFSCHGPKTNLITQKKRGIFLPRDRSFPKKHSITA